MKINWFDVINILEGWSHDHHMILGLCSRLYISRKGCGRRNKVDTPTLHHHYASPCHMLSCNKDILLFVPIYGHPLTRWLDPHVLRDAMQQEPAESIRRVVTWSSHDARYGLTCWSAAPALWSGGRMKTRNSFLLPKQKRGPVWCHDEWVGLNCCHGTYQREVSVVLENSSDSGFYPSEGFFGGEGAWFWSIPLR